MIPKTSRSKFFTIFLLVNSLRDQILVWKLSKNNFP